MAERRRSRDRKIRLTWVSCLPAKRPQQWWEMEVGRDGGRKEGGTEGGEEGRRHGGTEGGRTKGRNHLPGLQEPALAHLDCDRTISMTDTPTLGLWSFVLAVPGHRALL